MKKGIYVLIFIVFFIIICFASYGNKFTKEKDIIYAYGEIIEKQTQMDKKIKEYIKDDYTFEKAKVIVNPYELCPLTALIIFNTDDEVSIGVNINGKDVTKTEKTKSHVIPIYGLYDNYNNIIKLTLGDKSVNYSVVTEEFDGNRINVEKTLNEDGLYFVSPNFESNAIYDSSGKLVWYIVGDYAGDIEYLSNGHFYISDPYQGTNGVKINYSSFIEMDYLGKIYNQYVSDFGYHHELIPLSESKMLVLGAEDKSDFLESVVYTMNLNTGKIIESFDLYDILYKIDSEWTKKLGTNYDIVINSAQYFKDSKELLISVRGLNSIMMINMENYEIKWIFGDKKIYSDAFKNYFLKPMGNTRYTAGQHSAFITEDGLLGVHNNDYDMFNKSIKLKDFINNYTSVNLYKIDYSKKTIESVWEYSSNKKEFSKVAGYFDILDDGNKLITYGWSISQEAYKNVNNITINNEKYLNGVIEEIDKNDNIVFRATSPDLIYRTYKISSLYKDITDNYEVQDYKRISNLEIDNEEVLTLSLGNEFKNAKKYNGNVETYINRIILTDDFLESDEVNVYLVSKKYKTYIYNYKEKNKKESNSIRVSQENGIYSLYVKVNDVMYDTQKVINFN